MSKIRLAEGAAPETPATGKVYIYPKTDGKVYSKDDTGTEYDLTAGAGGESNTASNVGSVGTGIYKQKTGVDLELYKLNSTNNLLTIALDETDKIDFTFNQSNITEVGTITTGVWHGTEIDVAYGGTGASTLTDGGILLGSGTGAITAMSVLGDGEVVVGDGVGDPTVISAFTSSTGKLKHEVGGIEADISAIAKGGILAGTDDGAMGILPAGTDGYFLKRDDTQATGLAWASVSGLGDVLGPASSTDNAVARFNGTGGKNIQSSGVIIDDNDNITFGGNVDISSEISDWTIKNDEPAALEIKKGGASPTNMIKFTTTIGSEVMRFYYDVVLDGALKIKDDDNSHTLNIVWDEAETASNRTLKLAVAGGDRRVMFNEDFTIGDGYVVSITAEDTNTDIVMDNANFEVESTDTTQRNFKITSDKAGDVLLTIKENFTIGDGYAGTLTYSATGKTLTVEDNSNINQDLTTDASPTFDGLTLGVSDSGSNSLMTITGAGTGSPEGGEIRLEMAADYDTTYDFWRIDVNEDDLRFGAEGQTWVTFEADGTINVSGVTDYENLVTSDDDIPNKKYVDDYAIQDTADVIKDTHIDWGTGANQVSAVDIPIADDNSYFTGSEVETALDELGRNNAYANSPMIVTGGEVSEGTNAGTFKVNALTALLRATDSPTGELIYVTLSEQDNQSITAADTTYFVCLDYNGGSPQIVLSETNPYGTDYTQIPIGKVRKDGSNNVHYISGGFSFQDGVMKLHQRASSLRSLELNSGSVISYKADNYFTMTSGIAYGGINRITLEDYDSSVEQFIPIYRDGGGGWTEGAKRNTIDYTHYDDGDGTLGTIGNNRYGCHWVYKHIGDGDVYVVYGRGSYTLAEAQVAGEPSKPDHLTDFGLLIGKIIAPKSGGSFADIQMVTDTFFVGTSVSDHGELGGLGDDDHPQYLLADGSRDMTGDLTFEEGANRVIEVNQSSSGDGDNLSIKAGDAETGSNGNGGNLRLLTGDGDGTGEGGDIICESNMYGNGTANWVVGAGVTEDAHGKNLEIWGGEAEGAGDYNAGNLCLCAGLPANNGDDGTIYIGYSLDEASIQGEISFYDEYIFPQSDGSANQVLKTDGAGDLTFASVESLMPSASTTTAGKIEIATATEVSTGTDATRAVSPDSLAGSNIYGRKCVQIICFDYTTDNATGDGKGYFHIPASLDGMNLVAVHAEVITAGTTGTEDIQIHNVTQGVDCLSTKLSIDSGETGSDTAATPAVIDTNNDDVSENDLIRIDVDAVQTTAAKGLICTLEFQKE